MRWLAIVALLITACAHQPRFEHQDECIDPTMESMSWRTIEGPIAEVRDDGIVVGGRLVHFASVALDPTARAFLQRSLGKRATVWVNPHRYDDREVSGEVHLGATDLNRVLLRRGLARYSTPEAYSISDYSECLYRIAEREARASGAGIWSR